MKKSKKQARNLKMRIADWERMPAESGGAKTKTIYKPSGGVLQFTKPGSNRK